MADYNTTRKPTQSMIDAREKENRAKQLRDEKRKLDMLREKGIISDREANERAEARDRKAEKILEWENVQKGASNYYKNKNRLGNNEGGLLVPREGFGVGSIVRALSKEVLNSKKRWNKLSSKEQENIEKKFYDNLEPDSIDPKVVDKISDQEFDDVMINTVRLDADDVDILKEKFKGNFWDKSLSDLNKSQLDYLFSRRKSRADEMAEEGAEWDEEIIALEEAGKEPWEQFETKKGEGRQFKLPFQEGGMPVEEDVPVDTYPNIPPEEMAEAEASQLPDDEMEEDYIDFILDESLNDEEQMYLMNALEADDQLSIIFDKLIGTASEFSGAGEVDGPGTGVSDSIPARLSDGEFVITKKATDAIGPENLQAMMDNAEMAYDIDGGRELRMAFGGVVEDDELEDSKDYLSKTDEEIKKVMIGANKMPSVR